MVHQGDTLEDILVNAIARMKQAKHHPNAIAVQIVQIGNDPHAVLALKDLMIGDVGVITLPVLGSNTILMGFSEHGQRCPIQRETHPQEAGENPPWRSPQRPRSDLNPNMT